MAKIVFFFPFFWLGKAKNSGCHCLSLGTDKNTQIVFESANRIAFSIPINLLTHLIHLPLK